MLTRRVLLAAGGTVMAATAARKLRAEDPGDPAGLRLADPPRTLPEFGFTDADGRAITLAAYRGRGVVLNCWATWCPPCKEEMESLDQLARLVADAGIAVLPLSSDDGGAAAVQRFYDRQGLRSLPVLLDAKLAAGHALGIQGLPTTLLVGPDGLERGRFEGKADWAAPAMVARIRGLVGSAAPARTDAT